MTTYFLLRNNKKSGPYDLDQLKNFGLKPYDLVWVDGKSAAWRYPSEVEVLKDYAPAIEEQPFERFYKKPGEKMTPERSVAQQRANVLELPEAIKPEPSKKVFVSMPGNIVRRPAIKPAVQEQPAADVLKDAPAISMINEPVLKQNYAESFDEIKQRYTETYLNRKKKSKWTGFNSTVLQVLGGAIFFCAIVVLAYKNFTEEDKPAINRTVVIKPEKAKPAPANTELTLPAETFPVIAETKVQQPEISKPINEKPKDADRKFVFETPAKKATPVLQEKKITRTIEDKAAVNTESKSVLAEPNSEKTKSRQPISNISGQVNVKANNYKQRAFGGIQNLELTVHNLSGFILDKVQVELQYLKPSEEPIKTEHIIFSSVAPGGSQTIKIPDYLRGVKVKYKITNVASSQYETYTAGL